MRYPIQAHERRRFASRLMVVSTAAAAALLLGACASIPQPPSRALQAADSAINNAEQARVADYASAELTQAREKLAAARVATRNEQMREAELLAVEARVHAELAYAQAEESKARAINDEMQRSIDTLRSEMNRSRGLPQ
jgi:hypothetical protein